MQTSHTFRDLAERDRFIEDRFPVRTCADIPGIFNTPTGVLVVRELVVAWTDPHLRPCPNPIHRMTDVEWRRAGEPECRDCEGGFIDQSPQEDHVSTESKDGGDVLAEVIREQMTEALATDTGVTEVGMVEVEDQGAGEPTHTVEVEFNGDRYLITVARIDPVDARPADADPPRGGIGSTPLELVALVPLMDWLAEDGSDLVASYQESFGVSMDNLNPSPRCHSHRGGHFVPDLERTMTVQDVPFARTGVQMVEVVHDRWFDEAVDAYEITDPHTGELTLWVNAELVG